MPNRTKRDYPFIIRRLSIKTEGQMVGFQDLACIRETSDNHGFKSEEVRNQAIVAAMPMVKAIAQSIQDELPRHIDIGDLISAGYSGLIEAADRFDASHGASFSTFAYSRARGAILDSLREGDLVSRKMRDKGKKVEAATNRLTGLFGRKPTEFEIASYLEISVEQYRLVVQCLSVVKMVNVEEESDTLFPGGDNGVDQLLNLIPDLSTPDPHSQIERAEAILLLRQAIEKLPDRQRAVISLYYQDELTMSQIGIRIGVNESCVSKTHAKALLNLRASMLDTTKAKSRTNEDSPRTEKRATSHRMWGSIAALRRTA